MILCIQKKKEVKVNELKKATEEGLRLLRAAGMNFSVFKGLVSHLLINSEEIGEDEWVDLYNTYAASNSRYKETVEEWANEFFSDWDGLGTKAKLKNKK